MNTYETKSVSACPNYTLKFPVRKILSHLVFSNRLYALTDQYADWELEIVEAIKPQPGDWIIGKREVCDVLDSSTPVPRLLKGEAVGVVVICGISTMSCVDKSISGGLKRGYEVIVAADCHTFGGTSLNVSLIIEEYNQDWVKLGATVLNARNRYF